MVEIVGSTTRSGVPTGKKFDTVEAPARVGYRWRMSTPTVKAAHGTAFRSGRIACRLAAGESEVTVWLEVGGQRRSIVGRINKFLARDALRHGQDLVEELLDKARIRAERLQR